MVVSVPSKPSVDAAITAVRESLTQSSSTHPPHHIFNELQRLSAQLDRTEHHRHEKLDHVNQRLDNMHSVLGVLAEAMNVAMERRRGGGDRKANESRETIIPKINDNPIPYDLDENGVLPAASTAQSGLRTT